MVVEISTLSVMFVIMLLFSHIACFVMGYLIRKYEVGRWLTLLLYYIKHRKEIEENE